MNVMNQQIKDLFVLGIDLNHGLWLSGYSGEGECAFYYDNGQISSLQNYKNNILNGPFLEWWYDGKLHKKGQFKDRIMNKEYQSWDQNGELYAHKWYKDCDDNGQVWVIDFIEHPELKKKYNVK